MSAQIVTFAGQKGGIGKTTSSMNLGAALRRLGERVLLVDMDFGSDLTRSSGVQLESGDPTVTQVLKGDVPAERAIIACSEYDLLPASPELEYAAVALGMRPGRELYLRRALSPVLETYDWILVDCAGGLGMLAMNGLAASSAFVAVVQTQPLALDHVDSLFATAGAIAESLNPELGFAGYLPTMYNASKGLHTAMLTEIQQRAEAEGVSVLPTIRENVALAEAKHMRQSVFSWKPDSHGAKDYQAVAEVLVEQVSDRG